jgi:predicted transcriptional regulator
MNKPKDLSRRERQLLETLYRLGRASAAEIHAAIPNAPTYTAVRTHLTNLEEKGMVKVESEGARYIYEPAIPREEMAQNVVGEMLSNFFENRVDLLVSTLINRRESRVSQEDLDRLADLIQQAREEGK